MSEQRSIWAAKLRRLVQDPDERFGAGTLHDNAPIEYDDDEAHIWAVGYRAALAYIADHALNRDDRGCGTLAAAIYIALPMGAIWAIYLGHTVIAAVLCYVTVAVSVALLLGHMMRRDDQDEWDQYVEEAIDLASMPLSERIAADMAPEMVREIEDHLREVGK